MFSVFSICYKVVACSHWSAKGSVGISTGRRSAERDQGTRKEPIEVQAGAVGFM